MHGQHSASQFHIEVGQSGTGFTAGDGVLLDAALAAGIPVPFSCRRGECGSCKVTVLSGSHQRQPYVAAGTPFDLAEDEMLLCQSQACSDMRVDIAGWSLQAKALRLEVRVVAKTRRNANVVGLSLMPVNGDMQVRAGQYVKFYLDDGSSRCFSVANIPAADGGKLEFHIRRVAGGRFSEQLLDGLDVGAIVSIEGAFGACTWQPGAHTALVLFATGTGYAGIKPILLAALAEPNDVPVSLYWGGAADDFYDHAWLTQLAASDARFHWVGVSAGTLQDAVTAQRHDWRTARVYACGNAAMVQALRQHCVRSGLPVHQWIAEAFVPSGSGAGAMAAESELRRGFDPVWERVGAAYSLDGMLAARAQSMRAVAQIIGKLRVGMRTSDAVAMANQHLQQMGASHTWHPTYIRFGDDTVRTPRQGVDAERCLRDTDIVVVDIGPVWDGYEGDFGDTVVFGANALYSACAQAARDVFHSTRQGWQGGLSGRALYDLAEQTAAQGGWVLERNLAGHRVADFPHALFGPAKLAEMDIVPSEAVWVLEIQLRHPTEAIGAFYEDILIGTPGQAVETAA